MNVLFIPPFLFLLLISIFFIPLGIELKYKREGKNDVIKLNIFLLFKFIGLRIKIPYLNNRFIAFFTEIVAELDSLLFKLLPVKGELKIKEKVDWVEVELVKLKQLLSFILDKELMSIIFKNLNVKCYKFSWISEFGFTNPALTGIFNGFFWSIKGIILNVVDSIVFFYTNPQVEIYPDFYDSKFNTKFEGIFSVRLGNIILTVFKIFSYKIRGGNRLWENIQLKH